MKHEVIERLFDEYKNLHNPNNSSAIKYYFINNGVNVNLYFDAFDEKAPVFIMILNFAKKYYFTTLNITSDGITLGYLKEIPYEILDKILDEKNSLTKFYTKMEEHILNNSPKYINYKGDVILTNTMRYSCDSDDLPFLWNLRKVNMPNETLRRLSATMSLDEKILKAIQSAGFTVVRTGDVNKRISLTCLIDRHNIIIE